MRFTCNVCEHDNPCNLLVKHTNGFSPKGCPFDPENNGIEPEWREVNKIAKNTEQQLQPDSRIRTHVMRIGGDDGLVIE